MNRQDFSPWETLLNTQLRSMTSLGGGRNSRVWRIGCFDGQQYIAKQYFCTSHDSRNRLGAEWTALQYLSARGITCVPLPLRRDSGAGRAVYSSITGESPAPYGEQKEEMQPLVDFVRQLYDTRFAAICDSTAANFTFWGLPPASEACFSLQELGEHVYRRFADFATLPSQGEIFQLCKKFLELQVFPALHHHLRAAGTILRGAGTAPDTVLPPALRIPSPSDFGFHNAIRRPDGTLCFVDFEYFGMDDPVKLLADVCLHPGMQLTFAQKKFFAEQILHIVVSQDPTFAERFRAYLPLWRLKWCAILLNEFLPLHKARRIFAGADPAQEDVKLRQQLDKAQLLLGDHSYDTDLL